ncbi:SPFH domain-containing protein [Gimesia chilikensis]|jgi:membrane protease subunit (stomatin/prohibitin family)|uniref:SPFH domain-containing protein n=1 Tax=Gimesia chilikensis TaxID=2605989 RepID=UPI00118A577B|nr:SPFH domain-containing protein [Gimesia chilikensis]QDT82634.1 SPFH domain / Band 7 family protein [Gimesia chilikensis]
MGFWMDKLRGELVDIIEWIDDSKHTLTWRFPRYQNEIKNGAELIVRPGQMALFVHRGQVADVFEPGHYQLTTDNLPILATLQGWKHGFNSPFRSEVYFVNTTQITDLKWGTPNPIMLRDPEFGPIRLRAFGNYSLKANDPRILVKELVGTDSEFHSNEINELLRSIIISSFADLLGESKYAALDLASKYTEISLELKKLVNERIDDEYGLEVPQMLIVNISLPESVEKALDTRTSMGVIGDMNQFQQYQMGQAMLSAAENPAGGGAADGMGLGMGFAMANRMMQPGGAGAPGPMAPPPPPPAAWHIAANGQSQGPFALEVISDGIAKGQITANTQVWSAGMSGWLPAGQVPQLAALFQAATPPPPPPAS